MGKRIKKPLLYLVIVVLFVSIFTLDILLPLGVASGVLYITVVLLHNFTLSNRKEHTALVSIISICLVVIGYFYSPSGGELWKVLTNRILSIYVIWITAFLLIRINKHLESKIKHEHDSAEEKEVLLREIHHRVKNNLQVIVGLLSLQSNLLDDEKSKAVFQSCEYRIDSMGLIHEMLYKSGDLSKIDYKTYLHNLTEYLINSFHGAENNIDIQINSNNISLNLDTAIPLGLIITEIITNSLKYGLINEGGTISINLEQLTYPNFKLEIGDTGVGYSGDLNLRKPHSLGFRLIQQLTNQLKGSIEKERSRSGTNYLISFQEIA